MAFDEAVAFRWQRAEEVQPGEAWDGTTAGRLDVFCTAARGAAG